ncbi:NAD(P)H-dependent oxidoreductase [Bradyrhizobium diazoefficiens]|jgi:FMN-dependent NADH-azoreductase|uniref:FMN-dependent NADH-azoreductase n=1 Tax=Bradyrhizobium sp. WYCCWR 12699 TaxID=3064203 RepID=UPI001BA7904E|nr:MULTISPECIES: NAD(P)H-dependent oxidoreductase [Bradyrhizobium]MBR0927834.1 NAD(P)H-dependent oxidoreductase [Bradyrhizobium diazoefficiens]MDT4742605.1 NAD(P)H-dependent oxidoreductase [Bradyrhizobium sp. WYCCWR 12699]
MPVLLRIDSSARLQGSVSRDLGDGFEAAWRARGSDFRVTRRDLAADPVPQITQTTIAGFYTAAPEMTAELRAATALSDMLIAELKSADEVLITAPMYNFTIPAALKAWIDQIVRINQTFSYDGTNFKGLLTARRATVASAYGAGGYLAGGPLGGADFCFNYLKFVLGFLGVAEIQQIGVEATTGDPADLARQVEQAKAGIAAKAA